MDRVLDIVFILRTDFIFWTETNWAAYWKLDRTLEIGRILEISSYLWFSAESVGFLKRGCWNPRTAVLGKTSKGERRDPRTDESVRIFWKVMQGSLDRQFGPLEFQSPYELAIFGQISQKSTSGAEYTCNLENPPLGSNPKRGSNPLGSNPPLRIPT